MKKLCSAILAICLIAGIAVPARAADEAEADTPPAEIATVSTVEDLIAAIEAAEDGDTIQITAAIRIEENCTIGNVSKNITIVPSPDFTGTSFFNVVTFENQDILFCNLIMDGQHQEDVVALGTNRYYSGNNKLGEINLTDVTIQNFDAGHSLVYFASVDVTLRSCKFLKNEAERTAGVEIDRNSSADIIDCTFDGNFSGGDGGAVRCCGDSRISNCIITNNQAGSLETVARGGGGISVDTAVKCEIKNCTIIGNSATIGGGIQSWGDVEITDSLIYDNTATAEGDDLSASHGARLILSYSDSMEAVYKDSSPVGFYGDVRENRFDAKTNCEFWGAEFSYENIEENFFGIKFIFQGDLAVDDDASTDEDKTESNEPSEDTTEDNNTSTTPPEPPQSDDDDEDDYIPPTSHKPVHRPSKPNTATLEPEPAPALACGDAIIDVSRSVVLLGYGDGLLHLEDYLTRAQMAKILYALLQDASLTKYDSEDSVFDDVSPDAWYCRYVSTIARAGIVFGVGSGKYNPDAPLTWGHIITVLSRFVEAEEYELQNIQYDGWALNAVKTAVALGWIEDDASFDPDAYITRGEFVAFVNSVLEKYR